MNFALLAPAFLAGLAALAVPIIIHLTHRERRDVQLFPSLMFLRQIPYRSVRRQRIRHVALFLVRCAAIILLVLAFARPFLGASGANQAAAAAGGRELVVLLDQSYSMGYGDRWARGVAAARGAIEGLRPSDRATLVLFAQSATATGEATSDRVRLRSALETARPSAGVTRYAPALKIAQGVLAASTMPRREVVMISDFQKSGWDAADDVRLPEGTVFTPISLADGESANVAVTAVTLQRDFAGGREQVRAAARVINKGGDTLRAVEVALELNGRRLESKTVRLAPNSAASVPFAPFPLPEGTSRGIVRAGDDRLPLDNTFHFALAPGQAVSVLILESPGSPAARSLYLRRALPLGDRPPIRVDVRPVTLLAPRDLQARSLVVLNDAQFPTGDAGRRLSEFVESGGGLLIVLGEQSAARQWPPESASLLPAPIGRTVDRMGDRGGLIGWVDYSHPVFELFSAPRSGEFTAARFFRYRALEMQGSDGVLARFDDGSVALAEKSVGAGKVLLWTSSLDNYWNDLAIQPVFLPFVHQLAKYAARYIEARPWVTVGQVLETGDGGRAPTDGSASGAVSATGDIIVEPPSGRAVRAGAEDGRPFIELVEAGFYQLRRVGDARPFRTVAANVDVSESDLTTMDPEELAAAVRAQTPARSAGAALVTLTPEERERRQAVWWYLLVVAVLMLAAETLLSNRLSRAAR